MLEKDWLRFRGKTHPVYCTCRVCQQRQLENKEQRPGARAGMIPQARRALNAQAEQDLAQVLESASALPSGRSGIVGALLYRGLVWLTLGGVVLLVGLVISLARCECF